MILFVGGGLIIGDILKWGFTVFKKKYHKRITAENGVKYIKIS